MILNNTLYLSRSAIEDYRDCPNFYKNRYHEMITGIVPARPNRYLEMGTAVHMGMELVMRTIPIADPGPLYNAVWNQIAGHLTRVFQPYLQTQGDHWTLQKDICLCYGLVRTFCERFLTAEWKEKVWWVERDVDIDWYDYDSKQKCINPPNDYGPIKVVFESKADLVTFDPETKRFRLWNHKTSKYHPEQDGRTDKAFKHDLQGITESYCLEQKVKEDVLSLTNNLNSLENPMVMAAPTITKIKGALTQLKEAMEKFTVDSVSYLMFIKGAEKQEYDSENVPTGRIFNDSPLVEGYQTRAGGAVQYAWTKKIKKPENDSGYGYLGKNWERFYVHENSNLGSTSKERIDNWLTLLKSGIQEEEGDPLAQLVVQTPEKFRSGADTELTMKELKRTVGKIIRDLEDWDNGNGNPEAFERHRGACSYPTECVYKKLCFGGLTAEQMVATGDMKRRESHHKMERKAAEEVVLGEMKNGVIGQEEKSPFPVY